MPDTNDTRPAETPQDDERHRLLADFAARVDRGDGVVDSLREATGTTWEAQNVDEDTEPTAAQVKYPDVRVQLTGEDGSAFMIIVRVTGALRKTHGAAAADAFARQATDTASYDELLQLVMSTVVVG